MRLFALALVILLAINSYGQSDNTPINIGVYPLLTSEDEDDVSEGKLLSGIITELLVKNPGFNVLPRTVNQAVMDERNLHKLEDFILSESVAEQGVADGAKYLLAGSIESFELRTKPKEFGKIDQDVYESSITFSLTLVDVAKGSALDAKSFTINSKKAGGLIGFTNESHAIDNMNKRAKRSIANWIVTLIDFDFKILKVTEFDRKNLPNSVLISGGDNMDLQKGEKLNVVVVEDLDGYKIETVVAQLTVTEVKGQVTQCRVSSGKKELSEKLEDKSIKLIVAFQELE